eukprot:Nk52_evm8s254 gene=Nk52_evmTU8s254
MVGVEKAVIGPEQVKEAVSKMRALMQGHWISQAIHSVVMLGVPDAIGADKCSVDTIAKRLEDEFPNLNKDSLARSLSLLSNMGVFEESCVTDYDGERVAQYTLTDCSKLLQTGVPNQPSLASGSFLESFILWGAWGKLFEYMAGTIPADCEPFRAYSNSGFYEYFSKHPTSAMHFNNFMSHLSTPEASIVTDMFDWAPFAKAGAKVVDIGGSKGTVLAALKEKYPSLNCINFDLEEVIEHAKAEDANSGVEFVAGDMFNASTFPASPDVLLMKHILHTCLDDDCAKALRAIHEASGASAKLILVEGVLPEPGDPVTPSGTATKKVNMLMNLIKGRERSRKDWGKLLRKNGWDLEDIIATPTPSCQILVCNKSDER